MSDLRSDAQGGALCHLLHGGPRFIGVADPGCIRIAGMNDHAVPDIRVTNDALVLQVDFELTVK